MTGNKNTIGTRNFDIGRWKWKTSGFRSEYGRKGFSKENALVIAQKVVERAKQQMTGRNKRFLMGFDTRQDSHGVTSREIAGQIASLAHAQGLDVIISQGYVSFPEFSHYVLKEFGSDPSPIIRGIMVTRSHDPAEGNGICPVMSNGSVIDNKGSTEIVDRLTSGPYSYTYVPQYTPSYSLDMRTPYQQAFTGSTLYQGFSGQGHTVVVDPMGGTGGKLMDSLLRGVGFRTELINDRENIKPGDIRPYPAPGLLTNLESRVGGSFLNWNLLFPLFLDYVIEKGLLPGTEIASTYTTTRALDMVAAKHGITVNKTPTGFKYVSQHLRSRGCFAGFEGNGGAVFKFLGIDKDAFVVNFLMARIAAERLSGRSTTFGVALDGDSDRFGIIDTSTGDIMALIRQTLATYGLSERFGFMEERFYNADEHPAAGPRTDAINKNPYVLYPKQQISRIDDFGDGSGTQVITLKDKSWTITRRSGSDNGVRTFAEGPTRARRNALIRSMEQHLTATT